VFVTAAVVSAIRKELINAISEASVCVSREVTHLTRSPAREPAPKRASKFISIGDRRKRQGLPKQAPLIPSDVCQRPFLVRGLKSATLDIEPSADALITAALVLTLGVSNACSVRALCKTEQREFIVLLGNICSTPIDHTHPSFTCCGGEQRYSKRGKENALQGISGYANGDGVAGFRGESRQLSIKVVRRKMP
jgi:hypothetical protein